MDNPHTDEYVSHMETTTVEPSDAHLREIWREGLRSTGRVPALTDYDAYDHGITAAIRAVWDAARAADAEEIGRLESRIGAIGQIAANIERERALLARQIADAKGDA